MLSSGDADVEWIEDDADFIPVLSATREADGSAEEQPESTKSFDIELVECRSVAVTLNTCFTLVTSYHLYVSSLIICC